jgi:hypothetical protein
MLQSIQDPTTLFVRCTFVNEDLLVGEIRTGNGDETELLVLDHIDKADALGVFDAYTHETCGWPLSTEYPVGWRIEHSWGRAVPDGDGGFTIRVLCDQQAHAFPVTRWTDREEP